MKNLRAWTSPLAAVAILGVLLSCAESVSPTREPIASPPQQIGRAGTSASLLSLSFLSCEPMTADSVTESIGSSGGTIEVGPHTLTIPWGALDSTVSITAIAPSDTINRVQLYPEGLTFEKDVYLAMSYENCEGIGSLLPKKIAYVDVDFDILSLLASLDLWWTDVVIGKTDHFSDYVVAW